MFHPPQASVGLALLPVAWAASDRARDGRGMPPRSEADDLARYFPAGYERGSLPDAPLVLSLWLRRLASAWQRSALAAWGRRRLRPASSAARATELGSRG